MTHILLLVRVPANQFAGKRVSGFAQITDIFPTLLGRLGLKSPTRVTGQDLWPYVTGERKSSRDHVISAYGYLASVRTPEWNYLAVWNKEKYTGQFKPQLYDCNGDPKELVNVAERHPSVVKGLHEKLERYIASGWEITRGSFNEKVG